MEKYVDQGLTSLTQSHIIGFFVNEHLSLTPYTYGSHNAEFNLKFT